MIYTSGPDETIAQGPGSDSPIAGLIEHTLAVVAEQAIATCGVNRIIVAGGETSGAVVRQLGIRQLHIGPRVAAGVCWAAASTARGTDLALVLKSGNFGQPDLFITAWEALK